MRLVYKNTGAEVKVGDTLEIDVGDDRRLVKVNFFRPPHKPSSEGLVTVSFVAGGQVREYYVSVIGAEWVEREDREPKSATEEQLARPSIFGGVDPAAAWPYPTPGQQLPAGNPEPTPPADDLPVYGGEDDVKRLKPGLYLGLFHGRDRPDQEMDDWGFDGPAIGPLKYAHFTYASNINVEFESHEDWKRYFPDQNVVAGFSHVPAARGAFSNLGEDEVGPFDSRVGGWPKLNDPAVRQSLLDRGLVSRFDFKREADLSIVQDGLVEFRGKYYGDWTLFVAGHVLPTAAQMAEELRDRPDLHQRVIEIHDKANELHDHVLRLIEEVR